MRSDPQVRVFSRPEDLFEAAAEEFILSANAAVREKGHFDVALSGGSTPKTLYSLLANKPADTIPWREIRFFWGDERHVPPDHPDSNYRMANEAMLSLVPIDPKNVFRVLAENPDASAAAAQYEQTLHSILGTAKQGVPRFDLIFLGLGPDAHTASLFPGTKALQEKSRLVVSNWVDKFKTDRITLTLPVINHAAQVMFLVTGKDKAAAVSAVFDDQSNPEQFPAKLVKPTDGILTWLIGQEAAAEMRRAS